MWAFDWRQSELLLVQSACAEDTSVCVLHAPQTEGIFIFRSFLFIYFILWTIQSAEDQISDEKPALPPAICPGRKEASGTWRGEATCAEYKRDNWQQLCARLLDQADISAQDSDLYYSPLWLSHRDAHLLIKTSFLSFLLQARGGIIFLFTTNLTCCKLQPEPFYYHGLAVPEIHGDHHHHQLVPAPPRGQPPPGGAAGRGRRQRNQDGSAASARAVPEEEVSARGRGRKTLVVVLVRH